MKRKIFPFCILMLVNMLTMAQTARKAYFPAWTYHQKNVTINGLSVGAYSGDQSTNTNTNGIKLEALGFGLLVPLAPRIDLEDLSLDDMSERVNGLSISGTGTTCKCQINGLSVGTVAQLVNNINGISATMLLNITDRHNGLQIGGINLTNKMKGIQLGLISSSAIKAQGLQLGTFNDVKDGTGIQIGLFNTADHFKGVQLGLYNKNQKRRMPFVNWNFSD